MVVEEGGHVIEMKSREWHLRGVEVTVEEGGHVIEMESREWRLRDVEVAVEEGRGGGGAERSALPGA